MLPTKLYAINYEKKINVVYVNLPIMNQLSYHVDDQKIKNRGLILKSNIDVDIKDTLLLFKYLKNEMQGYK